MTFSANTAPIAPLATAASWLATTTGLPSTRPQPTTTPQPWRLGSSPFGRRIGDISTKDPASTNISARSSAVNSRPPRGSTPVSYTHLRAHETVLDLVCRLLLEKKKK